MGINFDAIPTGLKDLDQWVVWQYQPDKDNPQKLRKLPISPSTGHAAKSNDASTWASYNDAVGVFMASAGKYSGVGFMFTNDDPFCGIDLDDCIDQAGNIAPAAMRLVELCNSYTEISPSKTGLKIFGVGSIAKAYKPSAVQPWGGAIEVYSTGRYFTLTGQHVATSPTTLGDIQTALDAIVPAAQPAAPRPAVAPSANIAAMVAPIHGLSNYYKAWVSNTVQRAINIAANAPHGQRHNERLKAGRLLGGLVAHGLLDKDEAAQIIYDANPPQSNQKGELSSIYNAIDEGIANPLEYPTPNPNSTTYKGQPTSGPTAQPAASNVASQPAQSWPNALDLYTIPNSNLSHKQLMPYCYEGQIGAARLLAVLHKDTLAYDTSRKRDAEAWYLWNGQRWVQDSANTVWHVISAHVGGTWLALAASLHPKLAASVDPAEKLALADDIAALQKAAKKLHDARELQAIAKLAAGLLGVGGHVWDSSPYMLGCANGYIDLRSGQLQSPNPTYKIRKLAPTALDTTPPSAWVSFLDDLFPCDSEYAAIPAYLQRLFGLSLLGKKPDHVLPILWGAGRNGKGTMLETIKAVLGEYAEPASQDLILDTDKNRAGGAASPHWADLQGKRLVWASETGEGAKFNLASAKFLSGGDSIKARGLHQNPITFAASHLFMLLTNHKPRASADDPAFWSRVHLIPFVYRFLHPHELSGQPNERPINTSLLDELANEADSILGWLVAGCLEYQQKGLQPPASIIAAAKEYRNDEDILGEFLAAYIVVDSTASGTNAKDIFTAWGLYCEDAGLHKGSSIAFGKKIKPRLVALGARPVRLSTGVAWNGISVDMNGAAASYPADDLGAVGG